MRSHNNDFGNMFHILKFGPEGSWGPILQVSHSKTKPYLQWFGSRDLKQRLSGTLEVAITTRKAELWPLLSHIFGRILWNAKDGNVKDDSMVQQRNYRRLGIGFVGPGCGYPEGSNEASNCGHIPYPIIVIKIQT